MTLIKFLNVYENLFTFAIAVDKGKCYTNLYELKHSIKSPDVKGVRQIMTIQIF